MHVAADDRTGALEVAAAIADRLRRPVPVTAWTEPERELPAASLVGGVIDLASRHASASEAGRRAGLVAARLPRGAPCAHKIDSTLRGNWAVEVAARLRTSGGWGLVVAALPALARTCRDGVVRIDGVPLDAAWPADDLRRPVCSARPAEHLADAGLVVRGARSVADLATGPPTSGEVVVLDAETDTDLTAIGSWWRDHDDGLLVGTSATIAAAVGGTGSVSGGPAAQVPRGPALVVVGSLNPVARRQAAQLVAAGARYVSSASEAVAALADGRHAVLVAAEPTSSTSVDDVAAERAASEVAAEARRCLVSADADGAALGSIVVLGGDTAAAVLGVEPMSVVGSLPGGAALVEAGVVGGVSTVPVITRAGGFGDELALVGLLSGTLPA